MLQRWTIAGLLGVWGLGAAGEAVAQPVGTFAIGNCNPSATW